ncbi:MAG: insulinase family protein [Clostridia bacterium]|nr:insulinase family protein [Clostridia bacterium]
MTHKRIILQQGVELLLICDKKFKTDIVSASFISGEGRDAAVCSALLSGVLSRSAEAYPSLYELNRRLDSLYDAHLSTDTVRRGFTHIPTFSISTLQNRFSLDGTDIIGGALDVLYNVIFEPEIRGGAFGAQTLKTEKQQLCDAINGIRNSRGAYAVRRCIGAMMADQPLYAPRLGNISDAESVTEESLYAFYNDMIASAPVRLTALTGGDEEKILEFAYRAAERLGERQNGGVKNAKYIKPKKKPAKISETVPVRQDVLCVGCSLDADAADRDIAARAMFYEVFFQNPTCRLFERVREKLGLCYYCSAVPFSDLKKLVIYAGIDGKNRSRAESEILKQLELIKEGVEREELERCRLAVKSDLVAVTDSPSRIVSWFSSRALAGADPGTDPAAFSRVIDTVTEEDVLSVASRIAADTVYTMKGAQCDEP